MARTRAVRSATSQFFINLADNSKLDHHGFSPDDYGYAVFGRVIAGMDVVDRIAAAATTSRDGMDDVPETPIVIRSITVQPPASPVK
jgi:peptidyl-prolyl cis-trans isomerase B (cyclophilin B)